MGDALFLLADNRRELNTSYFRCIIPHKYLTKDSHNVTLQSAQDFDLRLVGETVLIERLIFPDIIKKLRLCGARRIVGTLDDGYHIMPESAGTKGFWNKERLSELRDGLKMIDLLITPSDILCSDYSKSVKTLKVPNFHDDDLWKENTKNSGTLRIGWGGSLGHATTWQKTNLTQALKMVKDKYSHAIDVVIHGKIPLSIVDSGLPCNFVPTRTPFEMWPSVVRSFDIGLAPLAGAYDRRRSNLKVTEYGLASRPFVASDDGEYCTSKGGILCKDRVQDWFEALCLLIEDASMRERLGEEGRVWAESYLMSNHVEDYENVLFS